MILLFCVYLLKPCKNLLTVRTKRTIKSYINFFLVIYLMTSLVYLMTTCSEKLPNPIVSSPNENVNIAFSLVDGKMYYSVLKDGELIIDQSQLGIALNQDENLESNFIIKNVLFSSFDETWEQPWGEEIFVRNNYNEMTVELQETIGKQRLLSVVFRAFDDGIGFRYIFPEQENLTAFEIDEELTQFKLTDNHDAWWIPASSSYNYEALYQKSPINQLDSVCVPLTIETSTGKFIAIHEANLTDYAGMNLKSNGATTLTTGLAPWSTGVKVYAQTPFVSPWRTVIIADNLDELVNSRIMLNLNEPCKIEDTSWIHPSKYIGIWWGMHLNKYSWGQGATHGATTENMKKYIDFAAENKIHAVLAEGWNLGWDGEWYKNGEAFHFNKPCPDFDLDELSKYSSMKGIDIIGHHETAGSTVNYEKQLDSAFSFAKRYGIRTVKTGYVTQLFDNKEHHNSQYGVRHYRKVVETAAKHQIAINNHEPIMPTGLHRTYPNLMTQEGIRGQEFNAWDENGGNPPSHTCTLPFTRGLAGPMDYTPGVFNFNIPHPKAKVQSTIANQLALYVVLYSPLQMACDLPENYEKYPHLFQFIKDVPTDWQATKVLDSSIGNYATIARKDKHSEDWYIGCITNEEPRKLTISLDFLSPETQYIAQIYSDGENADWACNPTDCAIRELNVNADSSLNIQLAAAGGQAIRIIKK